MNLDKRLLGDMIFDWIFKLVWSAFDSDEMEVPRQPRSFAEYFKKSTPNERNAINFRYIPKVGFQPITFRMDVLNVRL